MLEKFTNQTCGTPLFVYAENGGYHVLRVIKNPVAACPAYDEVENFAETKSTLIYQLRGNSVEVSLVTLNNGLYRVVDSKNLNNIGSDKFTDLIMDILDDEFKRKNRFDQHENTKRSMIKLKSTAKNLEQILSTMELTHCTIDALFDGVDFDYYLNRQRFEGVCGRLYEQILAPVDEILAANRLTSISLVILAGAVTKMCKLQSLIMQKFENSSLDKPEVLLANKNSIFYSMANQAVLI